MFDDEDDESGEKFLKEDLEQFESYLKGVQIGFMDSDRIEAIVYLSLCRTDNHITKFKRAEWIAHRNFEPISALNDQCLEDLIGNPSSVAAE